MAHELTCESPGDLPGEGKEGSRWYMGVERRERLKERRKVVSGGG